MTLRPATIADADMLLAWRNDPSTRDASHSTDKVQRADHVAWLKQTLANPDRELFIAEEAGIPVGTVRADHDDGVCELSWTVAPDARGRGVAKRMVALLAAQISRPIRAEVKPGNVASDRVAEHVGMTFDYEANGVRHYVKHAKPENEQ